MIRTVQMFFTNTNQQREKQVKQKNLKQHFAYNATTTNLDTKNAEPSKPTSTF